MGAGAGVIGTVAFVAALIGEYFVEAHFFARLGGALTGYVLLDLVVFVVLFFVFFGLDLFAASLLYYVAID